MGFSASIPNSFPLFLPPSYIPSLHSFPPSFLHFLPLLLPFLPTFSPSLLPSFFPFLHLHSLNSSFLLSLPPTYTHLLPPPFPLPASMKGQNIIQETTENANKTENETTSKCVRFGREQGVSPFTGLLVRRYPLLTGLSVSRYPLLTGLLVNRYLLITRLLIHRYLPLTGLLVTRHQQLTLRVPPSPPHNSPGNRNKVHKLLIAEKNTFSYDICIRK